MPNIELPPTPAGDEAAQLQQMYRYLYQLAEDLRISLNATGGNELSDDEMQVMQGIIGGEPGKSTPQGMESLKSLIIKTAEYVQNSIQDFRTSFIGETAANGQFGEYVRRTQLDVDVTPTGVTQNYTFREIIQGLRTYEVNAKNYIKTGLLRTVDSLPVYGVAIGKDIVTFSEDGTETYNDGNKVAELTADELSFWQGGSKIASYKGNRISFLYNSQEVMYIANGKLYCAGDFELTTGKNLKVQATNFLIDSANKKMVSGDWTFDDKGMKFNDDDMPYTFQISSEADRQAGSTGISMQFGTGYGEMLLNALCQAIYHTEGGTVTTRRGIMRFRIEDKPDFQEGNVTVSGLNEKIYGYGRISFGDNDYPAKRIFVTAIRGFRTTDGRGAVLIAPNPSDSEAKYGVYIGDKLDGNQHVIRFYKSTSVDRMEFYGDLYGSILCSQYPNTNFNAITTDGKYWVAMDSMTNGPSGVTYGVDELEVTNIGNGAKIFQRLWHDGAIYMRTCSLNTWGSWYKFTGTAV